MMGAGKRLPSYQTDKRTRPSVHSGSLCRDGRAVGKPVHLHFLQLLNAVGVQGTGWEACLGVGGDGDRFCELGEVT